MAARESLVFIDLDVARSLDRIRRRDRPHHAGASRRLRIRTRLYTAAVKTNIHPTRAVPLWRVLRIPPTVFIQPKHSSIRLRLRWLTS